MSAPNIRHTLVRTIRYVRCQSVRLVHNSDQSSERVQRAFGGKQTSLFLRISHNEVWVSLASIYIYIQGVSRLVSKVIPPFSRTYVDAAGCPFAWWSGIEPDLVFWKKNLKFFILSWSGPGTSSAWFSGSARFSASLSWCYPRVFNFLAWKPLQMVNLT